MVTTLGARPAIESLELDIRFDSESAPSPPFWGDDSLGIR